LALLYNNGLWGEGTDEHLYLDIGRIIGNFHFSIVPVGTLELMSPVREGANFFFFGGGGRESDC